MLAALGDPRDFAEMLPVPAGPFTMGSKEDDRDAQDREKPQHTQHVDAFAIGKYPITNSQYAQFVAARDHEPPPHWRGPEPPPELRNHPVVNVIWHDARAYCDWLSEEKGREYRLPTEAEWEKTARGAQDVRAYPWGDDFDAGKCNMDQTGIGGTSPVGMFAAGVSPYGCLDMSGNVWEWTMTKSTDDYTNYEPDNRPEGGGERCVAARSTSIVGSCAAPPAAGSTRTSGTTDSRVSGCRPRPSGLWNPLISGKLCFLLFSPLFYRR